jgi:hypothetical protein
LHAKGNPHIQTRSFARKILQPDCRKPEMIKGINTAGQALHPPLGGFRGTLRGIKPFVSSLVRSCPCKHGRDLAPFVNKTGRVLK